MKNQSEIGGLQLEKTDEKIWTRDFLLICISNFFVFLSFQMTLPTIPLFVKHLGGNDQLIGLVVGVFTFSALLIRPIAGHVLESRGRRFVYLLGLAIFTFSLGSYAFATSIFFSVYDESHSRYWMGLFHYSFGHHRDRYYSAA